MITEYIKVDSNHVSGEVMQKAGEVIHLGGLVAFPTETVYGLGGDAFNAGSSKAIYQAKGRPSDNPLIVHICCFDDIYKLTDRVPESAFRLAKAFWPGPLTMILEKSDAVPYETTGGLNTVAVRMPDHPVALAFIKAGGGFIAAPSANSSGRPSPTLAEHVMEDLNGRIEMILDGGEVGIGVESTIVDLTTEVPMILRPGRITKEMLESVLNHVDTDKTILDANCGQAPKAPGMKYRHYAPKGALTIVEGETEAVIRKINEKVAIASEQGLKTGIIATEENVASYHADVIKNVGNRGDDESVARNLYKVLREFDHEGIQIIYSESFTESGFGQAVMNRLLKAAGHKVIEAEERKGV